MVWKWCWTSLCCCINARKWWHSISLVLIEDCWSPWIWWAHENKFVLCSLESLLCALCLNCVFCFFSLHSSFQGCQKILCVCAIFKIAEKICVCEFYASRVCIQVCLWFLPIKLLIFLHNIFEVLHELPILFQHIHQTFSHYYKSWLFKSSKPCLFWPNHWSTWLQTLDAKMTCLLWQVQLI
jgi:hypothetical protein